MPKKLNYQYSVSVSFQKKNVKKQANQAEIKFLLNVSSLLFIADLKLH